MNCCPHCGLAIPTGTYHEGHGVCLGAMVAAIQTSPTEAGAIELLRKYGDTRFDLGHGVGLHDAKCVQRLTEAIKNVAKG